MKVLLIDVNCKHSSTGKIVYGLYSFLNSYGDIASICYGRGLKVDGTQVFKFGLDWETNLHAALARISGYNGYFSFFSTKRLINYIDSFKPDLIHIHELHAYFVNYEPVIKYILKKGIPIVWTFHCEYMYTGKCGYAYDCEKWMSQCGNCPDVAGYPKSLFFDFTKSMYLRKKKLLQDAEFTIVTPSEWLAKRVKMSFLGNKQIVVIHNGIDTRQVFFPRDVSETDMLREKYSLDDRKIVLSVAPNIMEDRKGGEDVLQIARSVHDLQFVLVGAETNEKYEENVLMIKRTKDQDELARWYSIADVFLICSKKENFPTTCLESLSCGTPIVGLSNGGTSETTPAPIGMFFERINKDMIDCLKKIKKTNEVRETARGYATEHYDLKVMSKRYLELYERLSRNV